MKKHSILLKQQERRVNIVREAEHYISHQVTEFAGTVIKIFMKSMQIEDGITYDRFDHMQYHPEFHFCSR